MRQGYFGRESFQIIICREERKAPSFKVLSLGLGSIVEGNIKLKPLLFYHPKAHDF
jgi:hypothetical protein